MPAYTIDGKALTFTFDSVSALAECALEATGTLMPNTLNASRAANNHSFAHATPEQALEMVANGWQDHSANAVRVAEDAVTKVESEQAIETGFVAQFDVSGATVDIGRYLEGEPECMIDYPLAEIVKAGKVITVCASVCYSGSIKPESLVRRGTAVAALVIALSHLGYAVEVFADFTTSSKGYSATVRTCIKSAHDVLDESRILFALAHPAMSRMLSFGALHAMPHEFKRALNVGSSYGHVTEPPETLPEGTIYLPGLRSDRDVPDADKFLLANLRELGLVTD